MSSRPDLASRLASPSRACARYRASSRLSRYARFQHDLPRRSRFGEQLRRQQNTLSHSLPYKDEGLLPSYPGK